MGLQLDEWATGTRTLSNDNNQPRHLSDRRAHLTLPKHLLPEPTHAASAARRERRIANAICRVDVVPHVTEMYFPTLRGSSSDFAELFTDMQENTWARLRDSCPGVCAIHAT